MPYFMLSQPYCMLNDAFLVPHYEDMWLEKEKQLSYLRSVELSIISCLRYLQVHSSMARFLSSVYHIFSTLHYHSSAMIYECLLYFFFFVVANIAYYMGDLFSFKLKPVQHSFWPKYLLMLTSLLPTVINNNFYYCGSFSLRVTDIW